MILLRKPKRDSLVLEFCKIWELQYTTTNQIYIYIYYTFDYKVSKIGHDIYNVGPLFFKMVYEPMNTIVTSIKRHSYCCYNPA